MTMTIGSQGDLAVVALAGRLDSTNAAETEARILAQIESGHPRIVVDASGLNYSSSAGLRVFLVVAKRVKAAGGGLALHSRPDTVQIGRAHVCTPTTHDHHKYTLLLEHK